MAFIAYFISVLEKILGGYNVGGRIVGGGGGKYLVGLY